MTRTNSILVLGFTILMVYGFCHCAPVPFPGANGLSPGLDFLGGGRGEHVSNMMPSHGRKGEKGGIMDMDMPGKDLTNLASRGAGVALPPLPTDPSSVLPLPAGLPSASGPMNPLSALGKLGKLPSLGLGDKKERATFDFTLNMVPITLKL